MHDADYFVLVVRLSLSFAYSLHTVLALDIETVGHNCWVLEM